MPAVPSVPFLWDFSILLAIALGSGLILLTQPSLRRNAAVRLVFAATTIGAGVVGATLLAGFYLLSRFFND
jgi:hypothetical protein